MTSTDGEAQVPPESQSAVVSLKKWGENSFNPMLLATFITPQHLKPVRPLGLAFVATFIGTSYLSIHGYKKDAGGIMCGASGTYALLAMRQKLRARDIWGPRGILRGITIAFCAVDMVAGGLAYTFNKDTVEE